MSVPLVDSSQLAAAGNLSALKQAAGNGNPQALREAARQFESLFTSMMLKSMRQASFKDPIFGSDQADLYQEMYDDQVAAEMSKGKGLGLADMLVRQLRGGGIGGGSTSSASSASSAGKAPAGTGVGTATAGTTANTGTTASPAGGATANTASTASATASPTASATASTGTTATAACPTAAQQTEFANALWPQAQQAAQQLGVSPVTLLAQAALETDWGRKVPQGAAGGTSNNLFGIKASAGWSGSSVVSSTQEYSGGVASTVKAPFRSYDSMSQCFQDYVDLLKSSPRYAAALGTGGDTQAFGSALQQGGYATDPAYASKLTAVAGTLTRALTQGSSASLKFTANLPTTAGSGTLQRR
jgi:flagellar protein FlgJ